MEQKKKRKWPFVVGGIVLAIFLAIAGYFMYVYQSIQIAVGEMHEPIPPTDKRVEPIEIKKSDPISILLIGVDERKGDVGRADSLIVITANPTQQSMQMVSIPRDTLVEIPGHGEDKINHSYAFGGVDLTIDTVEHFLDIPIDYYYKVNMESFQHLVDALGGIDVENTFAFSYLGFDFPLGKLTLNGEEALAFSRMRKKDPNGDFGRQDRQKAVILGIINKGANILSLTKMDDILSVLGKNITTNMTFSEMKDGALHYKDVRQKVDQFTIQGSGKLLKAWYYVVPEEERLSVSEKLKKHLEIE